MPVHSARPFIVRSGELVVARTRAGGGTFEHGIELDRVVAERGEVPIYVAEIAVARAQKEFNVSAGAANRDNLPTLSEIERDGGFDPQRLLDLLAGGGSGTFERVWRRSLPDVDLSDVTAGTASRFPLRGGPATDGTGVEQGFVPRYLAKIAYVLFQARAMSRGVGGRVPTFDELERAGGFKPHEFLDLLCGGDGSGGALMAMNSRAVVEARNFVKGMKLR